MAHSDTTASRRASTQDFTLHFFTQDSRAEELQAAFGKKWEWAVSRSGKNAFWYALLLNNLQQTYRNMEFATMIHIRNVISEGIKRSAFDRLKLLTQLSGEELGDVVRIPARTLSRREVFHADESERILRIAAVFQKTIEVFEDLNHARRWFSAPRSALGGKSPLQFCDTDLGAEEVMNLLGRIDHGVFS